MDKNTFERAEELQKLITRTKNQIKDADCAMGIVENSPRHVYIKSGIFPDDWAVRLSHIEAQDVLRYVTDMKQKNLLEYEREFAEL